MGFSTIIPDCRLGLRRQVAVARYHPLFTSHATHTSLLFCRYVVPCPPCRARRRRPLPPPHIYLCLTPKTKNVAAVMLGNVSYPLADHCSCVMGRVMGLMACLAQMKLLNFFEILRLSRPHVETFQKCTKMAPEMRSPVTDDFSSSLISWQNRKCSSSSWSATRIKNSKMSCIQNCSTEKLIGDRN